MKSVYISYANINQSIIEMSKQFSIIRVGTVDELFEER